MSSEHDTAEELIEYLWSDESYIDCTEDTHANSYDEYSKDDVMRETLEWCAEELEEVVNDG